MAGEITVVEIEVCNGEIVGATLSNGVEVRLPADYPHLMDRAVGNQPMKGSQPKPAQPDTKRYPAEAFPAAARKTVGNG